MLYGERGEGLVQGARTESSLTRCPRLSTPKLAHRPGRKPRGELFIKFFLSPLFYFGVKVGDGFDQFLILGYPNPLSSARAWVRSGVGREGP